MDGNAAQRLAKMAFMVVVTGCLLGLVFEKAAVATNGLTDVLVYALTVAFGLEFLIACWPTAWSGPPTGGARRPQRGRRV